jgi:hypothetical protein
MFPVPRADHPGGVRIEIDVRSTSPPVGRLTVDGGTGPDFDGWLQLLAALAEVFPPTPSDSSPGSSQRHGGCQDG